MNNLTLTINGTTLTAPAGMSILQAAHSAGISIPTLCFDKTLESTGSCWMCIVELKGKNLFVPACSTTVSPGMIVETENSELQAMRRQSLERIIDEHCGDCLGPCEISCPAGCNIPGFIAGIAEGNDREAIRIIKESIPLPGILGRVCPAPCEDECRRHGLDEPVAICALKRYAADRDMQSEPRCMPEPAEKTGMQVAVVGAGPAGLTAAYYLLALGHDVTIFDAHPEPGGMMRYGIPRFRLPEAVIESDIEPLRSMGARFRMNTRFGREISLDALKAEYDAAFLALGAQKASAMGIPGEELPAVKSGITFLRDAACGIAAKPGKKVLVAGGGNTAIDAARTALRLGTDEVTILYRRTRQEMPANHDETEDALREGIELLTLVAPAAISADGPGISVTVQTMRQGEPDGSGRRRPVPVPGAIYTILADTLITATGQHVDCPAETAGKLRLNADRTIAVNPDTLETGVAGIFAGGDCVTGADLAIRAVEQGKKAAQSIDRYLRKMPAAQPAPAFNSSCGPKEKTPAAFYAGRVPMPRIGVPEIPPEMKVPGFMEIITGYNPSDARAEASRCLGCRCIAVESCRLRELASRYLPDHTCRYEDHPKFDIAATANIRLEREKCVDCGICVRTLEEQGSGETPDFRKLAASCPTGAMSEPMQQG